MGKPVGLIPLYKAVAEQRLGVTAHVVEQDRALMFTYGDVPYVLRNTGPDNPGLLDLAVYLAPDEDSDLKEEACQQVVLVVPCLKAWVDSDGDVVLNLQTLIGRIHLLPTVEAIGNILPEALDMLRYAVRYVTENVVLAGIVRASEGCKRTSQPLGDHTDCTG